MATITAEAKLYTGIRCWCVDKNISAALSSSFALGNQNQPSPVLVGGVPTVYPGVKGDRLVKFIADIEAIGSISLTNERYKTYGFGNNVISSTGIDNSRNWRVNANLACKFPTYIRIDIEKLQLPEGTDCIVQLEEGWVLEGDYPGSFNSPSPRNDNFVQFRTPWYGVGRLVSAFSVPNTVLRIKQLASGISSAASVTAYGIFNPGKFAALFGGVFITTPNASKKVVTGSNINSLFATSSATILKIKQLASNVLAQSNLVSAFDIVQVVDSAVQITASLASEATKFKGLIDNFIISASTSTAPVKTARGRSLMNVSSASISVITGKLKAFASASSASASLSATINHIQRSPRWIAGSTYSIIGGLTNIVSDNEYVKLNGTQMRRYASGSLAGSDSISISLSDETKQFDAGPGGFYVAAGSVVEYGTIAGAQSQTISIASPVSAVCKVNASKFAVYNPSSARIEIYNTSGVKQTIYDTIAVNTSTPRSISIRSGSSTNLDIVSCNSGGFRHMKYNGGSYVVTTITTPIATDFRRMTFSDDGLTLFIDGFNKTAAYFMTRASLTSSFTTIQTITDSTIAVGYGNFGFDLSSKQFVFIDNRSYQWNGSNYVYIRDAVYNSPGIVFGNALGATHISGTTATNLTFS